MPRHNWMDMAYTTDYTTNSNAPAQVCIRCRAFRRRPLSERNGWPVHYKWEYRINETNWRVLDKTPKCSPN